MNLSEWLPMSLFDGPPLPRRFNIFWPWVKTTPVTPPYVPPVTPTLKYKLTVHTNVLGGGSVTIDPDRDEYFAGESVTLTAVPASGYFWTGWTGDVTDPAASIKLQMTQNLSITANFQAIPLVSEPIVYGATIQIG